MPEGKVRELPVRSGKHQTLQPKGWPQPKGYANGIKARDGIPFGTWHHRFVDWAADLKLLTKY